MKATRAGLFLLSALILVLVPVCIAAPVHPAVSASPVSAVPSSQLTPPATIRVKHDARNPFWPDWPADEIRVFNFDEYVAHVCALEMSDSWPLEALKAQSIAARAYAWYYVLAAKYPDYDITDWSPYQAMRPGPHPNCDLASRSTSGQYLSYNGWMVYAMYSAENGDPTLDSSWGNPYLRAVEDPVSFGFERYGHGLGMSQNGARRWAQQHNWDYQKILMHYYTGVSVELPLGSTPDNQPPLGSVVFPWSNWYFTGSRMFLRANATDAMSGVSRADFAARLAGGVTTTIGSDASAAGGWTAVWDVSALPDQRISTPIGISMTVRDVAGNVAAGAPALIGLDRTPPTVTAALDAVYTGGPTVTLRLGGSDAGSGLAGMALSNDWVWEGESLFYQPGWVVSDSAALNGSAWRARAGIDPVTNTYGPWTTVLPAGQYRAYFRLKTTGVLTTALIARLDVITSTGGTPTMLGLHEVRGGDFRASGEYQEMAVEFDYPRAGEKLEFRTHFLGVADLYLDRVLVVSYPVPFATRTVWQVGNGPLPKTVRVKTLDGAGNVSPDAIVVVGGASPSPTPTATPGGPTSTATATSTPTATPGGPTSTVTATTTPTSTVPTSTPSATRTPGSPSTKTPSATATETPPRASVRVLLPVIIADFAALPTPTRTAAPTTVCNPGIVDTWAVGQEPHGIAVAPGRIYVANFTEQGQRGTVSVLDSTTGYALTSPIAVGLAPNGAAYNPANGMVYIANRDSNDVSVIDGASNRVVATVAVGLSPNGVAVDPSTNRIYVANWDSNDVSVIDGASNHVMGGRLPAGSQPAMIAANRETNLVYVANHGSNSVTVIRSTDNAVLQTITLAGVRAPYGVAVDSVANRIYVVGIVSGRMAIIDGASGSVLGTTSPAGGMQPWQAAANGSSGHVLVTSSIGGVGVVHTYDSAQAQWLAGTLAVGVRPEQGMTLDPDNGRVYVANGGSDSVSVVQDCALQ